MVERTLCLIKPDAVERCLVGEIIKRIESKGLQIVGLKMMKVSQELAKEHYAEHSGKGFYPLLVDYITSGPLVALCLEGHRAVQTLRNINGKTDPLEATAGTIRGDFALCKGRNLVHASDSIDAAQREISLFFEQSEIEAHTRTLHDWIYRRD